MGLEQAHRVDKLIHGEPAPQLRLTIRFAASAPADVLERSRAVMRLVASAQSEPWPSDDQWHRRLPDWFTCSFDEHTLLEMLADTTLWDFGSWLDAMKHPGWEWWSSGTHEHRGVVECSAHAMPFAIEPLYYLLRAAGAEDVELCGHT